MKTLHRMVLIIFGALVAFSPSVFAEGNTSVDERPLSQINLVVHKNERVTDGINRNTNDANSAWQIVGYTDLIAFEQSNMTNDLIACWTNSHPIFSSTSDPLLSQHAALDAELGAGNAFICYKEGPALFVEQIIPAMVSGRRERDWLGRDVASTGVRWTYAAFTFEGASKVVLTVTNNVGDIVTWCKQPDRKWELDSDRSKPEAARLHAYQEWCHLVLETNHWIVTERYRSGTNTNTQ
jgi:hypothetical protein